MPHNLLKVHSLSCLSLVDCSNSLTHGFAHTLLSFQEGTVHELC